MTGYPHAIPGDDLAVHDTTSDQPCHCQPTRWPMIDVNGETRWTWVHRALSPRLVVEKVQT